jgi:hypothetical protein
MSKSAKVIDLKKERRLFVKRQWRKFIRKRPNYTFAELWEAGIKAGEAYRAFQAQQENK